MLQAKGSCFKAAALLGSYAPLRNGAMLAQSSMSCSAVVGPLHYT
jgi:hypothetical protein